MPDSQLDPKPSYKFPINNATDYKGTISFQAVSDPNVQSLGREALDLISAAEALSPTGAVDVDNRDRQAFYGATSNLQPTKAKSQPLVNEGVCTLYLPANLAFTDGVEFGSVELGIAGSLTQQGIASGGSALDIFKRLGSEAVNQLGSLGDAFTKGLTSSAAQLAAIKLAGKIDEGVRGGVELATGITVNPNKRSILRGVPIRNFSFTFKLIPTSEEEARAIKNIIYFFRSELYPMDLIAGGISYGYKFPNKWNISMNYKAQQVATRILPSFLTGVDTNYNPNSMSFLRDGSFPEIDLTLRFIEERALRKQDIMAFY